jgi:hypothetical protein
MRIAAIIGLAAIAAWTATRPDEIPFTRHMLDPGTYQTCAIGDINRNGHPDIVSGANWYEGPRWLKHGFAPSSVAGTLRKN